MEHFGLPMHVLIFTNTRQAIGKLAQPDEPIVALQ